MTRPNWTNQRLLAGRAVPIIAVLVAIGIALLQPVPAASITRTHEIKVGTRTRSWVQITPASLTRSSAPIIVVLSGINATVSQEMARDDMLGLPASGQAELIYPIAVSESWNAGGCCGTAAADNINDVAFLRALTAYADPGHSRPIYLVGYSNGGRLTYKIACTDPALFSAYAVVKAMPDPGCVVSKPISILQIDSTNDYAVPYQPGDPGMELPAATTEIADLRAVDGCAESFTVIAKSSLRLMAWTCQEQTQITFAVYVGGGHSWPSGTGSTASAASLIWAFFQHAASGASLTSN
jgi:polyhydroxybutyrate depolymerase